MRITQDHALLPKIARGEPFIILVDGQPVPAYAGETIAAALENAGIRSWPAAAPEEGHRCLYCGIGVCFSCLVSVDGTPGVRACVTPAQAGMRISTTASTGDENR